MKAKRKGGMSRRRFLKLGIASATASIGAVIATRWMTQSPEVAPTELSNCGYSWGPNTTRINEDSSALLQDALLADGLTPSQVEVYDRAMEYQTCYDAEGNIISSELLYRHNESAMVAFNAGDTALSAEAEHRSFVENVLDTPHPPRHILHTRIRSATHQW